MAGGFDPRIRSVFDLLNKVRESVFEAEAEPEEEGEEGERRRRSSFSDEKNSSSMCYEYDLKSVRGFSPSDEDPFCHSIPIPKQFDRTPFFSPQISPSLSLSSYFSCASNLEEMSSNSYFNERAEDEADGSESHDSKVTLPSLRNSTESLVDLDSNPISQYNSGAGRAMEYAQPMALLENGEKFQENERTTGFSSDSQAGAPSGEDSDGTENTSESIADSLMFPSQDSKPTRCSSNASESRESYDICNNPAIYIPPPAENADDDVESSMLDEDDDDGGLPSSSESFSSGGQINKEGVSEGHKSAMRTIIQGHFRFLVGQLLASENISPTDENGIETWKDIVSNLAWQAAAYIKPEVNQGGAMDPIGYVKVKCLACGRPSDSKLVKGVVFQKNVAHKHMITKYKNPRLLLLAGPFQRVSNELLSIESVIQQETDYLKVAVANLETHHPNVMLVEESVPRHARDYLYSKDISVVSDVKRPRLERLAQCLGAQIVNSLDNVTAANLKHCDMFYIDKVIEDRGSSNQPGKRTTKSLMFFEGCPKPLCCTVLLKGANADELKKVKRVVQYAVFAAYHLSLETSFLVDERATLPKNLSSSSKDAALPSRKPSLDATIHSMPALTNSSTSNDDTQKAQIQNTGGSISPFISKLSENLELDLNSMKPVGLVATMDRIPDSTYLFQKNPNSTNSSFLQWPYPPKDSYFGNNYAEAKIRPLDLPDLSVSSGALNSDVALEELPRKAHLDAVATGIHLDSELLHPAPRNQDEFQNEEQPSVKETLARPLSDSRSILFTLSSRCVLRGSLCKRNVLHRIQYYGSFDRPLGKFLRDELFDQNSRCPSCDQPPLAHAFCYTHQEGRLTINLRRLEDFVLPGVQDNKIWMWHRCLKCQWDNGMPQANRRVVLSEQASGLSFGKFLELSFSNQAASRFASCGHSMHRDCLRFYGFGDMVACFCYSNIDIHGVHLPPPQLEFNHPDHQDWLRREATEVARKGDELFFDILEKLHQTKQKILSQSPDADCYSREWKRIAESEAQVQNVKLGFEDLLHKAIARDWQPGQPVADILELNSLRRKLNSVALSWEHRLHCLRLVLTTTKSPIGSKDKLYNDVDKKVDTNFDRKAAGFDSDVSLAKTLASPSVNEEKVCDMTQLSNRAERSDDVNTLVDKSADCSNHILNTEAIPQEQMITNEIDDKQRVGGVANPDASGKHMLDMIGLKDTGMNTSGNAVMHKLEKEKELSEAPVQSLGMRDLSHTLDAAWIGDCIGSAASLKNAGVNSEMPVHTCPDSVQSELGSFTSKTDLSSQNSFVQDTNVPELLDSGVVSPVVGSKVADHFGGKLLLGIDNNVVAVYEDEPTTVIAYALTSKQYWSQMADLEKQKEKEEALQREHADTSAISSSSFHFQGSDISTGVHFDGRSNSSEGVSTSGSFGNALSGRLLQTKSMHAEVCFNDESTPGKGKYSVICYYALQFDALRKICCPNEKDFIRSLCRCRKWGAQGGKSKVFFAKTLDDRFIIKQVTKVELESFLLFASTYFDHLTSSLSTGSPTCLAKIFGIYQVTIRHTKGGKDTKMDLMVMENLLYGRRASRLYDLKGSLRNRYSHETNGVLLDQNFLEAMLTTPVCLGNKSKHQLERAVWNDTAFLHSINVMDYSLLVGIDEERKELVVGIIDYMRQYTWDKHLETWVKASGILGGPKNEAPTVISPKEYKKRFRKAISSYFPSIPDPLSPSVIRSPSNRELAEDKENTGD